MTFTSSPTEQTTAATDLVLTLISAGAVFHLRRLRPFDKLKVDLWCAVFGLAGAAALLGAAVHGIILDEPIRGILWSVLFLSLGLVLSLVVVGSAYDLRGRSLAARLLPVMLLAAVVFWGTTFAGDGVRLTILFGAVSLPIALGIYVRLATSRRAPGARVIGLAILLNVVGGAVQSTGTVRTTLHWPFDHNGICHLVQAAALAVLLLGLHRSLVSNPSQRR